VTPITSTVSTLIYATPPSNLSYQTCVLLPDSFVFLTALNKGGTWVLYTVTIPQNTTATEFSINPANGDILYTSASAVSTRKTNLWTLNTPIVTLMSTVTPIPLTLLGVDNKPSFYLTMYVKTGGLYTIYEIYGKLDTIGNLILTTTQKGDLNNIFKITVDSNVISYTTSISSDIAYYISVPVDPPNPLCVIKGGTGRTELPNTRVLLGNGQGGIKTNENFSYVNSHLKIGRSSYTFFSETLGNNVLSPVSIYDLSGIKGLDMTITVTHITNSSISDTLYSVKGISGSFNWTVEVSTIGNTSNVTFDIDSLDQLTYTSSNAINWTSTEMKARVMAIW
jgi:hypothetical protein